MSLTGVPSCYLALPPDCYRTHFMQNQTANYCSPLRVDNATRYMAFADMSRADRWLRGEQ